MSQPVAVDILSDDDDDDDDEHSNASLSTPLQIQFKKRKIDSNLNPTVFVIDDDPTPRKPASPAFTPSFVAETPMSDFSKSYVPIVKCTKGVSDPQLGSSSSMPNPKSYGISKLICLESDNESEIGLGGVPWKQNEIRFVSLEVANNLELSPTCTDSTPLHGNAVITRMCGDNLWHPLSSDDDIPHQVSDHPGEEADRLRPTGNISSPKNGNKDDANKKRTVGKALGKKRISKEEKVRIMEEKKQQKEQEKLKKAAMKAEVAEIKKLQKEKQKWEKGKFALKSIVAEIDTKVAELSVGGHLLTRLKEKGLTYKMTSNPIEGSIVWTMPVPEDISEAWCTGVEIPYVLLVYEAGEFCNLVTNESLINHVSRVRCHYPSRTVCYVTNGLMPYINKREQEQYKNPTNHSGWRRPPVEELLSKLTTHFVGVHSRLCIDEAELAEHVVGLTCSLASCQFRKKLTRLSVNANGSLLPKDCVDRTLIKNNLWLKALAAIPKVQPRFVIAIGKKYPTMKSLLSVYMDPSKSVHEKEFLLEDLITERLLGENRRLGEVCSKRVYRILMAQCGSIKTDDVEYGADFFSCHPS